jgi:anaerobic selenocysteine-containing dehydrogenase
LRSADIGRASPPTQALRGVCPHDCYDTCGLVLHVAGDRLVRVEGALDPPVTRGFVCRKVSHYPERRHHPDRILYPLQRVGPKGSGRFRRTSWAEALAAIAAALNDIRTRFGGEAILPYSFAGNMGVLASGSMDARFFHALGASRLDRTICTASANATLRWMFGVALGPDPETMVDAGLVILWGTNPMATNIHEVPLLDAARHQGAEIVTIDPLSTATARRYRPHVKLRPNTDLELALGVGNALLARGLADLRFIERYTGGIHAFQERARGYTLERTAAVTGIPRADLESLVHLMATRRPLLIRAGYGVQRQSRSAETVWALGVLSCLTGAWHDVGGGLLLSNGDAFPLNEERLTRPGARPHPGGQHGATGGSPDNPGRSAHQGPHRVQCEPRRHRAGSDGGAGRSSP